MYLYYRYCSSRLCLYQGTADPAEPEDLPRKGSRSGSSTTESEATEVKTYTYSTGDWKDLLMSVTYGDTTHTLVYDASGNPTTYGNGEQLYTNLTWEHGRQLTRLTTGGNTYTYDYDIEGIRTQKVGDGEQHDYITQNGKVVRERIISYNGWNWVLDFIYDNAGRPFALKYSVDGGETFTTYYYILNVQGDVVALLNAGGTVVARYTYNAWGELLSVTTDSGTAITNSLDIAHINPLRYRGYYYDSETGFYYLQSRYYDPENCRFINADCYTRQEYDEMYYMAGDFSECVSEMQNPAGNYDLYSHNCAQVSLSILSQANTVFSQKLSDAAEFVLPVNAYDYLIGYESSSGKLYSSSNQNGNGHMSQYSVCCY